jgi:hypothetical protein
MGCCISRIQLADGTYPRHSANSPAECQGLGFYYDPNDCQACPMLWHALGSHWTEKYAGDEVAFRSLSLITTSIFDIRYYLLVNSEPGRSLLRSYDEHAPTILPFVQDDPVLMRRITGMFLDAVAFGQDMLRAHALGGESPSAGHTVYDRERHAAAVELLGDIRAAIPADSDATQVLDVAQRFLDSVVGMSSAEVLALMRVRPMAESSRTPPPATAD